MENPKLSTRLAAECRSYRGSCARTRRRQNFRDRPKPVHAVEPGRSFTRSRVLIAWATGRLRAFRSTDVEIDPAKCGCIRRKRDPTAQSAERRSCRAATKFDFGLARGV